MKNKVVIVVGERDFLAWKTSVFKTANELTLGRHLTVITIAAAAFLQVSWKRQPANELVVGSESLGGPRVKTRSPFNS